jgi:hypothetical protein
VPQLEIRSLPSGVEVVCRYSRVGALLKIFGLIFVWWIASTVDLPQSRYGRLVQNVRLILHFMKYVYPILILPYGLRMLKVLTLSKEERVLTVDSSGISVLSKLGFIHEITWDRIAHVYLWSKCLSFSLNEETFSERMGLVPLAYYQHDQTSWNSFLNALNKVPQIKSRLRDER